MNRVCVPAYAKINLTLDVLDRRVDGFHNIRSIMQTVALHDTLEVTHTPRVPGVTLSVTGPEANGVPDDSSNIVHRAAVRLQKTAAARRTLPGNESGLHIALTKRIPSQAGLGGGSSDAAAALRAISRLFGLELSPHLAKIAAAIGADVPFFLTGGTALVEGLGENVTPLPPIDTGWQIVIVKPPVGVSTGAAYAALDNMAGRVTGNATERWDTSHLPGHFPPLGNDFDDVVMAAYPEIAVAYNTMKRGMSTGHGPMLSGSGSAIFSLMPEGKAADLLADHVSSARVGQVWVTQIQGRGA